MDPTIDRERWQRISAILDAALELPMANRDSYLDVVCADDAALRRTIQELLAAAPDTFLAGSAIERASALVDQVGSLFGRHLTGRTIGAYRILRELGEGGMGIVCLAERIDGQFEHHVAIKFVKYGLCSEDAQRRFLLERRILAQLEHPAIARLLDGGVTDEGTPFFVMERVNGSPVTTYCADRASNVSDRLRIFLQICEAVQYAHRHLIVHRDLKPSNILVDESGRVKLLDFGIAKLLRDERSEAPQKTIGRALTPDYAAPEQLRGEAVNTSADVYALGVLLYELLTGERPYRVRGGTMGEIERAILEQQPLAPSARTADKHLRRRLRGDLDRVVLKALQKSPDRRYPSAEAFATDVRRHLEGLPVSAQGDGVWYRARKFIGRHQVGVGAGGMLLLTLVGGLAATTWQMQRAEQEARKADAVKEFLKTLFSAANPEQTGGRAPSSRQLLDAGAARIESELQGQPEVQAEVTQVIGAAYQSLGEYDRAAGLYRAELVRRRAIDGPRSLPVAKMLTGVGDALYEQGRFEESGLNYEEALSIEREKRGDRTLQVGELLWDIAGVARNRGDLARAEGLQKEALAIYVERQGDNSTDAAAVRESLAITYQQAGRFREAAAMEAPVVALREQQLGPDHPHTLTARYNLAFFLEGVGQFEDAVPIIEDVVRRQRQVLGSRHNSLAVSLRLFGRTLDSLGRAEDAILPLRESLQLQTGEFGPAHMQVAMDHVWQAVVETHIGQLAAAEQDASTALAFLDSYKGPMRADVPHLRTLIGRVLADAGRLDEAHAQISRAAADLRSARLENVFLGFALDALGEMALRRGDATRAGEVVTEALTILDRDLDDRHPARALARVHLGAARLAVGDAEAGERLMREGLARLDARFPDGHADLDGARVLLAAALRPRSPHEARGLFEKTLAWREVHFGPGDPRTIAARQALATLRP